MTAFPSAMQQRFRGAQQVFVLRALAAKIQHFRCGSEPPNAYAAFRDANTLGNRPFAKSPHFPVKLLQLDEFLELSRQLSAVCYLVACIPAKSSGFNDRAHVSECCVLHECQPLKN